MNKINKNLIFLGAFIIMFFGVSNVVSAEYTCEPHAVDGTTQIVTKCYNYDSGFRHTYDANVIRGGTGVKYGYDYGVPMASTYGSPYYYDNTSTIAYYGPANSTNTTNGATASNTNRNTTVTRTVTNNKVSTDTETESDVDNRSVNNSSTSVDRASEIDNNGLSALSLRGSNTFMPDTVWEWICVFFLILVIIILIRQFRKQGHHDVHAVAHH